MKLLYSQMSDKDKEKYRSWHPDCMICGRIGHAIDHDHETDRVRGVLCGTCNSRIGSLEAAMRLPTGVFQTMAGDLHRGLERTGTMNLRRFSRDLAYLDVTADEVRDRVAAVHRQLTQRFAYWTEVTSETPTRRTVWEKTGPLTEEEAQQLLERLCDPENVPPHLHIVMTLEPDDGRDSPRPRALDFRYHTPGALEYSRELRGKEAPLGLPDSFEEKREAYARDVVPILLSRPLTPAQVRAAAFSDLKGTPTRGRALREAIGEGYWPRWVDLAVRIALDDLGEDLPDPTWASFTRARFHWRELCAHWNAQRRGTD